MPFNKLYNYINTAAFRRTKNCAALKPAHFQSLTDSNKNPYVIYDFKVQEPVIFEMEQGERYSLTAHHVSIYANQDDRNECLSQYHYTAYFEDKNQIKYKLHVYFNEKDQLTTTPIFSVDTEPSEKKSLSSDVNETLEQLANDTIADMMQELRKRHEHYLKDRENWYIQLEKKLTQLSVDLMGNHKLYLETINEIIDVLQELVECHYHSRYEALWCFFKRFNQASLVSSKPDSETNATVEPNPQNQSNVQAEKVNEPNNQMITKDNDDIKSKEPKSKKKPTKLIKAAKKRLEDFENIDPKLDDKLKVDSLLKLDEEIGNLLIADEKEYHLTIHDLKTIQLLVSQRDKYIKELVEKLLLTNQFELALRLQKYLNPVPENLIRKALEFGNAELLKFLIKDCDFPIRTYSIDGMALALYCLQKDSKKLPLTKCLSVLIEHGVSVMAKTDTGLSVAHCILSAKNHPLKQAFIDTKEKTIARPAFWKKLIKDIETGLEGKKEKAASELTKTAATFRRFLTQAELGKTSFKDLEESNNKEEFLGAIESLLEYQDKQRKLVKSSQARSLTELLVGKNEKKGSHRKDLKSASKTSKKELTSEQITGSLNKFFAAKGVPKEDISQDKVNQLANHALAFFKELKESKESNNQDGNISKKKTPAPKPYDRLPSGIRKTTRKFT